MRHAELDLSLIWPGLRNAAAEAFEKGDALGFVGKAERGNTDWLWIVWFNIVPLKARGIYEKALLVAFSGTRTNNRRWPLDELRFLFEQADRARLRAAGDPLPGPGPFTLYRGVSGRGRARRVRGFSWTADLDLSCWFAGRYGLVLPTVFRGEFAEEDVLVYTRANNRGEQEYLVDASKVRISRALSQPMIFSRAEEVQRRREEHNQRRLAEARRRREARVG
jgi:hypothetical protein